MEPTSAQSPAPFQWPPEVLERIHRVFEYHQASKLTFDSYSREPPPDLRESADRVHQLCRRSEDSAADEFDQRGCADAFAAVQRTKLAPGEPARSATRHPHAGDVAVSFRWPDAKAARRRAGDVGAHAQQSGKYLSRRNLRRRVRGQRAGAGAVSLQPAHFSLRLLRAGLEVLGFLKHARPELEFLKNGAGGDVGVDSFCTARAGCIAERAIERRCWTQDTWSRT